MLQRNDRAGLIEPCLPSPAKAPPSGPDWQHEIKHDGFRILALRNVKGVRLITRNGNDFTKRFLLIVASVMALPARSCLIDGEAIVSDDSGLAVFARAPVGRDASARPHTGQNRLSSFSGLSSPGT
jgi:bifunctional non-homologous end joining protein LigD